uniref:2Fe-2S ferredoxin-type domain-containing protein n=1 Tax=Palpitomonas bilix TaxID=652834 RepID=A0A7S3LTJ4_9EUKA|mmetsp:Transcript_46151/g.118924  ORF Transcript_46151/g.118924 Transcript_46151/m.118924 type:complete len:113 (+) Transcript_46151:401-739(+)
MREKHCWSLHKRTTSKWKVGAEMPPVVNSDVCTEWGVFSIGACEGTCACSTCHLYVEEGRFNEIPEPSDEENDMLDLAWGLKDTSRLGCQIEVERSYAGMNLTLPDGVNNNY